MSTDLAVWLGEEHVGDSSALLAGMGDAVERVPAAPEPMRIAVEAQIQRLGASSWS